MEGFWLTYICKTTGQEFKAKRLADRRLKIILDSGEIETLTIYEARTRLRPSKKNRSVTKGTYARPALYTKGMGSKAFREYMGDRV